MFFNTQLLELCFHMRGKDSKKQSKIYIVTSFLKSYSLHKEIIKVPCKLFVKEKMIIWTSSIHYTVYTVHPNSKR